MNISEKTLQLKQDFDDVYEAGKKSFYDEFWDSYQSYGNKTDYRYAFGNGGSSAVNFSWNETTFKPKYDIKPTVSVDRMLGFNSIEDLESHLNACGVTLDTSKCTNMSYMCLNSQNITLPTISLESADNCANLVAYANRLVTIRKIIFGEYNSGLASAFTSCVSLKNLVAEGIITGAISFSSSPLTLESAISVINHLYNYKGTAKEGTYSITFSSTTLSYLDNDIGEPETGLSWRDYITDIKGWSI